MAAIAGYTGQVTIASNVITTVTNWELDIKSDTYDTTAIQNIRAKSFIPGLYEGTGTLKFNWDASDTNGLQVLQTQILATSPTIAAFVLSTNNGVALSKYTFNAWIDDLKIHDPVNNKVEADVSFKVSGAITNS